MNKSRLAIESFINQFINPLKKLFKQIKRLFSTDINRYDSLHIFGLFLLVILLFAGCDIVESDTDDPDGLELERAISAGEVALYFAGEELMDDGSLTETGEAVFSALPDEARIYLSVAGDYFVDNDGTLVGGDIEPASVFWRGDDYPEGDVRHEFGFEDGDSHFPGQDLVLSSAPDAFVNAVPGNEFLDQLDERLAAETLEEKADVLIEVPIDARYDFGILHEVVENGGIWFSGDMWSEDILPGDKFFLEGAKIPENAWIPIDLRYTSGERLIPLSIPLHNRDNLPVESGFFRDDAGFVTGDAAVDAMPEAVIGSMPQSVIDAVSEAGGILLRPGLWY